MTSFWTRLFRLNARFLIAQLEQLFPGPPVGVALIFHKKGGSVMGEITVSDDETTLRWTLTLLDSEGQPTTSDTPPTYSSSDESVAVPNPAEDGLSGTVDVGSPGDAVFTADAGITDADGNPVLGKGTIHVTAGGAATMSIDFATG